MATDLSHKEASSTTRIVGSDELYASDVIQEDGVNKLLVKATTVPDTTSRLAFGKFKTVGGSPDMAINGSSTPVSFFVNADPLLDIIIREVKFAAFDGGIKVDTFLGLNSALTTGIQVNLNTGGLTQPFLPIQTTQDFDAHFAFGDGARFELITASGNDSLVAQFSPREPIVLKAGSADNLEIIIQDNLNQVAFLEAIAFGLYDV